MGTALYNALLEVTCNSSMPLIVQYSFQELSKLGMHTAIAILTLPNPASAAFHQKFGFTQESQPCHMFKRLIDILQVGHLKEVGLKFGRWHDVGYFQKML